MTIKKIWLTENAVHILTEDGREGKELFSNYPRLRNATRHELEDFTADSFGIHWNALNEDLCYEGFFEHKPTNKLSALFTSFPEINVSAFARRLGISQSLMAQYLGGIKTPSPEREAAIFNELRAIGQELSAI